MRFRGKEKSLAHLRFRRQKNPATMPSVMIQTFIGAVFRSKAVKTRHQLHVVATQATGKEIPKIVTPATHPAQHA